ncbi:O-antigen translocase [Dysgonomonas sp. 521]|uniref:O-antigen translocase n=1 Tax=Dysgonomonas sp. 521 TaxID=2302932 RepID=UPI0013D77FB7|nr:O-antigen translocase [Dysgonomonas sp. 521]NDV95030.1 O-antigen translocase [Dysgonomonas sp. 521]
MSKNPSYNQILKSTTIFGGSQIFIILVGIIRTKIIAILLGPAGVGLIGIYQSIIDMMRTGYGLGMDTAGVREIAEAKANADDTTFGKVISRFGKWFRWTAVLGFFSCAIFCYPISIWVFEDDGYALLVAALSICVSLAILTTGRSTILQGMRKIPELAKSNMLGSIFGLIATVPIYYTIGLDGIIPAFIITWLISFFCVEYYYRKQRFNKVEISGKEAFYSGLSTLKLGIFIVLAGLISTISMFLVRAYITREDSVDTAGLFQSAWVITNIYLGLILRSMGSDFFPRLSAIAGQKDKVKQLINEQSYIVLIIAPPAITGMLIFSDFALSVLYSGKFTGAGTLLCWQLTGTFFKVLSWPVAFIMLAKNRGLIFFMSEVAYYGVYLAASYLLYPYYGLAAAGIGYLMAYIVYLPLVLIVGHQLSEFRWDKKTIQMALINLILICITFYIATYIPEYAYLGTIPLLCISLLYAYLNLRKVFSISELKGWFKRK